MTRGRIFLRACLPILLGGCPGVDAAPAETWLSALGNDSNECTRSQPCRTLQRAVDAVAANGTVRVMNPGRYSDAALEPSLDIVWIDKPVTVIGGYGSARAKVAHDIRIGIWFQGGDPITLRNLSIGGGDPSAQGGIHINGEGNYSVFIENCELFGIANGVIVDERSWGRLFVLDTAVHHVDTGVVVSGHGSDYNWIAYKDVVLDNVSLTDAGVGVVIGASVRATVTNSTFHHQPLTTFHLSSYANTPRLDGRLFVSRAAVAGSSRGFVAQGGSHLWLSGTTVTHGSEVLRLYDSSTANSFGDNAISGNDTPAAGLAPIAQQ